MEQVPAGKDRKQVGAAALAPAVLEKRKALRGPAGEAVEKARWAEGKEGAVLAVVEREKDAPCRRSR